MFDLGLASMFPPIAVLSILADEIEKQLKFEVKKYVMIYDGNKNKIEFKINDEDGRRPFDEPAFADAIKAYVEPHLKGNYLTFAFIHYSRDSVKCGIDLHMTNPDTGDKINETIKL